MDYLSSEKQHFFLLYLLLVCCAVHSLSYPDKIFKPKNYL